MLPASDTGLAPGSPTRALPAALNGEITTLPIEDADFTDDDVWLVSIVITLTCLTLTYLTLPYRKGVLLPSSEASTGPNARPLINP